MKLSCATSKISSTLFTHFHWLVLVGKFCASLQFHWIALVGNFTLQFHWLILAGKRFMFLAISLVSFGGKALILLVSIGGKPLLLIPLDNKVLCNFISKYVVDTFLGLTFSFLSVSLHSACTASVKNASSQLFAAGKSCDISVTCNIGPLFTVGKSCDISVTYCAYINF